MVIDTSLLYTQHYKLRNKGKVEHSRERSSGCILTYLIHRWVPNGTTNPDQSGPGNNDNEEVFDTLQISKTGTLSLDAV